MLDHQHNKGYHTEAPHCIQACVGIGGEAGMCTHFVVSVRP